MATLPRIGLINLYVAVGADKLLLTSIVFVRHQEPFYSSAKEESVPIFILVAELSGALAQLQTILFESLVTIQGYEYLFPFTF